MVEIIILMTGTPIQKNQINKKEDWSQGKTHEINGIEEPQKGEAGLVIYGPFFVA